PNAALPHHHPGERTLQKGDTLIVDMGASLDGYNSDLTRSFYLGDEPEERFQQVYENVLQAQLSALNGIRPQMTGRAVDALARDVINAAGHEEHFGHGLGHGLGMEVHEAPRLSSRGIEDLLEPGMVVTVEPGIYITGWGGVRIEDLILVGEKGAILLSHCPKTPLIPV
ncbi:MAG TPA: M24 family metallopeptidase, partial [Candidatus Binatia bacterium]|nr:M24 family metallopeptidase [Candidatus Binatia bacterium]